MADVIVNGTNHSGVLKTNLKLHGGGSVNFVIPSGTKTITTNGTHDVTDYASAEVNVPTSASGEIEITENGEHDVSSYATANVNVPAPEPALETKSITQNGTYTPSTGYDGFSQVVVNVSGSSTFDKITITAAEAAEATTASKIFGIFKNRIPEGYESAFFLYAGDHASAESFTILFYEIARSSTSNGTGNEMALWSKITHSGTGYYPYTNSQPSQTNVYLAEGLEYYVIPLLRTPEVTE